jgi:hypothetical protein
MMPTKRKASGGGRKTTAKSAPRGAAPAKRGRQLPRRFDFHWGGGEITEEASFTGKYTEPSIQLLEYDGGGQGVRFCYYSLDGRFQRSPMMIDSSDNLVGLRDALKTTPKLRALLKKMVG